MAEIKKFKGLNNMTSPERMAPGELVVALDVDIDHTGRLLSRTGRTIVNATPCHSLFSYPGGTFLMQGTAMKAVEADLSLTTVQTLRSSNNITYDFLNGVAYFSNGVDTGRLVGRTPKTWGVAAPVGQPSAALAYGTLGAGRYLYALTFLRNDGHESGTGISGQIDLTAPGGVLLNNIEVSTNPDVTTKAIYISSRDGEVLYRSAIVPNTQTAVVISDEPNAGVPLTTQFAGPPPPGNIVRIFNGIAYIIAENVVYYSDPYNLELFRPDVNFMQFPGQVTLWDHVNDGIYVATADTDTVDGTTWFLSGTRPDQFVGAAVFNYGAVFGTSDAIETTFLGKQGEKEGRSAVLWISRHGVCLGGDGGNVQNLTEMRHSFPSAVRGASLIRRARGMIQYMTALQGTGNADNAYVETI